MIGSKALSWLSLVLTLAALCCALEAYAEDLKSASARFTDQSFALLDRLSKQGGDSPNPLLGPVASFSGDADSLRQALARSDLRSASSNISSLQADRSKSRPLSWHTRSRLAARTQTAVRHLPRQEALAWCQLPA
jgi:hypothetical protein